MTRREVGIGLGLDELAAGRLWIPIVRKGARWHISTVACERECRLDWVTPQDRQSRHIFISYRAIEPDLELGKRLFAALREAGHQVFMAAVSLEVGDEWSPRIDQALRECDDFLVLVSDNSAVSENVIEEIRTAAELRKARSDRRPNILPVRVGAASEDLLTYGTRAILRSFHYGVWQSEGDMPRLVGEVLHALDRGQMPPATGVLAEPTAAATTRPPLPEANLEVPTGQVASDSKLYQDRDPIDADCRAAILKPGALLRIRGPRQVGKTSLLARTLAHARANGIRTARITFQLMDAGSFTDLTLWFSGAIARQCGAGQHAPEHWGRQGPKSGCTGFFETHLLTQPLAVGIDEVDLLFPQQQLAVDFFGMLRAWNELGKDEGPWRQLRLAIVYSTEAYLPLPTHQSPFNVGLAIPGRDFLDREVAQLMEKHETDAGAATLSRVMDVLSGHPFLTRWALYDSRRRRVSLDSVLEDDDVFQEHLTRYYWLLEPQPELCRDFRRVCDSSEPVQLDDKNQLILENIGLVRRTPKGVAPRCGLYRRYFAKRLAGWK